MGPGPVCAGSRKQVYCEMSMCISIAQARTKWASSFAGFRRCTFTGAPGLFFGLCPFLVAGVGHRGILKTGTPPVQDIRHLFHPCGSRGTFGTLLIGHGYSWQAPIFFLIVCPSSPSCLPIFLFLQDVSQIRFPGCCLLVSLLVVWFSATCFPDVASQM